MHPWLAGVDWLNFKDMPSPLVDENFHTIRESMRRLIALDKKKHENFTDIDHSMYQDAIEGLTMNFKCTGNNAKLDTGRRVFRQDKNKRFLNYSFSAPTLFEPLRVVTSLTTNEDDTSEMWSTTLGSPMSRSCASPNIEWKR